MQKLDDTQIEEIAGGIVPFVAVAYYVGGALLGAGTVAAGYLIAKNT